MAFDDIVEGGGVGGGVGLGYGSIGESSSSVVYRGGTPAGSPRAGDVPAQTAMPFPPTRPLVPETPQRFNWTPKRTAAYALTFFVVTWLSAFLVTYLLVQVLLRISTSSAL